jgi:hypothetical protein
MSSTANISNVVPWWVSKFKFKIRIIDIFTSGRMRNGRSFILPVKETDTIQHVKQMIMSCEGTIVADQSLCFDKKTLSDKQQCGRECGICEGSIL